MKPFRLLVSVCLVALTVLLTPAFIAPAAAQASLLNIVKKDNQTEDKAATDQSSDELRRQAEADLDEVRQKLEENAALQPADAAAAADKEERQRLLDIQLYFRNEKLWRLNDLAALKNTASTPVDTLPSVKALGEKPPYSALRVDALRDELDTQQDHLQSLQNSVQMREAEKQFLSERLRKANEEVRLTSDKAAHEKTEANRRNQEIAELKKQAAEVELAASAADQDYLQAQISSVRQRIEEMKHIVARVLPAQAFSESNLNEIRNTLRTAQEKASTEVDQVAARHAKRLAERQRLLAASKNGNDASRLAFIDQALRADSMALEGLRTLQLLEQFHADAWEQRILLLAADSTAEVRQSALNALRQIAASLNTKDKKDNRWQQIAINQENLRAIIADLEARTTSLMQGGSAQIAAEKEVLSLYRNALTIYDRIAQLARRINQETARWIGDFTGAEDNESALTGLRLTDLWQTAKRVAYSVWNYELFTVEDISQADGQKITISYGITVGKSIGAIFLFGLGYWLFARITKRILALLVERGNVNAQVASVTRRWLMISVSVLLAVSILNLARIPLTVFTFVGGALAIGVGFGTQTIIKNFISGIILLFERKVRVGDIVVIGDVTGTVTNVDLRATTVKAFDGTEALIPNSNVLENQVINWTYSDPRLRREIGLQIEYGAPVRDAANIIMECAQAHGQVLKNPAPEVYFDGFADSGLDIAMTFWIELGAHTNGRRIDSDLRFMIEKRLAAAGINIPFPTRDVNLRAASPLPVTMATAQAAQESTKSDADQDTDPQKKHDAPAAKAKQR